MLFCSALPPCQGNRGFVNQLGVFGSKGNEFLKKEGVSFFIVLVGLFSLHVMHMQLQ